MWAAIVLAGGGSERLGTDKTQVRVGGCTALDRVLAAVQSTHAPPIAVLGVGAGRPTDRPVRWVREEPPGSGPACGVVAALTALDRGESGNSGTTGTPPQVAVAVAVVLAGDLPMLSSGLIDRLVDAVPPLERADGVRLVDADGRPQHLLGAYRLEALRRSAGARDDWAGASMRALLAPLTLLDLAPMATETLDLLDLDTPADVQAARSRLRAAQPRQPDEER